MGNESAKVAPRRACYKILFCALNSLKFFTLSKASPTPRLLPSAIGKLRELDFGGSMDPVKYLQIQDFIFLMPKT